MTLARTMSSATTWVFPPGKRNWAESSCARARDPCFCGTMARISMVYPPLQVVQVPVSSIMIMHDGLLRDGGRTLCLPKSIKYTKDLYY